MVQTASNIEAQELDFIKKNIDLYACPNCRGDLKVESETTIKCQSCAHTYANEENGVLSFFYPNEWEGDKADITEKMKSFYEETPFPNYDDFDNAGSLVEKARKGVFARLLDEQIPFNAKVIECGCGTGQLSNFLSIANRTVVGADMCLNSLGLASGFKGKNNLKNAHFYQMNLFKPCFKDESFDVVISNGVLHHTSDPYLGFQSIARLVKPKGHIVIGLYHKYGRLFTDFRRRVFNLTRDKFLYLDPRIQSDKISEGKRKAWFMDQYKNPHESKHTVTEVIKWLDETGFSFVKSIPKTKPFEPFSENENLFRVDKVGNYIERAMVNTRMVFMNTAEGGFFIIIGQKK